jgi:hypothetical protein
MNLVAQSPAMNEFPGFRPRANHRDALPELTMGGVAA